MVSSAGTMVWARIGYAAVLDSRIVNEVWVEKSRRLSVSLDLEFAKRVSEVVKNREG